MTSKQVKELYEKYENLSHEFQQVQGFNRYSHRCDLNAFLIMDRFIPSGRYIISAAEHDEIYFSLDFNDIPDDKNGEEVIKDLIRCGVCFDYSTESFYSVV